KLYFRKFKIDVMSQTTRPLDFSSLDSPYAVRKSTHTPLKLDKNGALIVPSYRARKYLPAWHSRPKLESFNMENYNDTVPVTKANDVAWPLSSIRGLRTQVVAGELPELIQFCWQ